jgi:selenocysteine-specific elongation factor
MIKKQGKDKGSSEKKGDLVGITSCFDAWIEGSFPARKEPCLFLFCHREGDTRASLFLYDDIETGETEEVFAQIQLSRSFPLKWKDTFLLRSPDSKTIWAKGTVLDPFSKKGDRKSRKRRLEYLKQLRGGERDMLLALGEFKGIRGLWEKEIIRFGPLSVRRIVSLSQELEAEGQIKILSFSPLFFIAQSSFLFLCEEIVDHLKRFHEKHPDMTGVHSEKLRKRFDLHPRILSLALRYLVQEERIKEMGDQIALIDFEMTLSPEEEKILHHLEEMCLKGEFQSVSMEILQRSLNLSSKQLHRMLTLLMDRKKVVLSKDGFILHSRWLEEIIQTIRKSGKKELTIADFKNMSGLSRKYAIPLLELLDQLGVTQRKGNLRKILYRNKKPYPSGSSGSI